MVMKQLQVDGFPGLSRTLSDTLLIPLPPAALSDEAGLYALVKDQLSNEARDVVDKRLHSAAAQRSERERVLELLEEERRGEEVSVRVPSYSVQYQLLHKDAVRCAAFSADGKWAATGSADRGVRVVSLRDARAVGLGDGGRGERALAKTYSESTCAIAAVDMHPREQIVAAASTDGKIRMFNYGQMDKSRSMEVMEDTHAVRSIHFHPTGHYLLAGTAHNALRLYDVTTNQKFTPREVDQQHTKAISCTRISPDGKFLVSASADGSIKVWDGTSLSLVHNFTAAHGGRPVVGLAVSRNGRYLLSSGLDSYVRLWDLVGGTKNLRVYSGCAQAGSGTQPAFSFNEDLVMCCDERTAMLAIWNTRLGGEPVQQLGGHKKPARCIVASHADREFATCSDDGMFRLFGVPY